MGLISRVSSRTYRKVKKTKKSTNMSVTVRTRQYMTSRLLNRKQMIVDVAHGEAATPSCSNLRTQLAKMYKSTPDCVILYGLQTKFGGGSTTGFANIYDSLDYLKKNEVKFRQLRQDPGRREDREESSTAAKAAEEQEEQGPRYLQGQDWCQEINQLSTTSFWLFAGATAISLPPWISMFCL